MTTVDGDDLRAMALAALRELGGMRWLDDMVEKYAEAREVRALMSRERWRALVGDGDDNMSRRIERRAGARVDMQCIANYAVVIPAGTKSGRRGTYTTIKQAAAVAAQLRPHGMRADVEQERGAL